MLHPCLLQTLWLNHAVTTLWPYYNKAVAKMVLEQAKPQIDEAIKPVGLCLYISGCRALFQLVALLEGPSNGAVSEETSRSSIATAQHQNCRCAQLQQHNIQSHVPLQYALVCSWDSRLQVRTSHGAIVTKGLPCLQHPFVEAATLNAVVPAALLP